MSFAERAAEYKATVSYTRSLQARAAAESGVNYAAFLLSDPNAFQTLLEGNPFNNEGRFKFVHVTGEGATVSSDEEAADQGVSALVRCALRHGGLEEVTVVVRGPELDVAPVTAAAAQVVLGEDLRDLGAAVAVRAIAALGGSVSLDGETLTIAFS